MNQKLGRKPHADSPIKWNINLPTSLAADVELLLLDPLTGIPGYGKRSKLIQQLLYEWVEKYRKQPAKDSENIFQKNLTQAEGVGIINPPSPTNTDTTS